MFEVVLGIILVFIGWMEFAYAKLMRYKREARTNWMKIEGMLKGRSILVNQLLDEMHDLGISEIEMEQLFDMNYGYIKLDDREKMSKLAEEATKVIYSFLKKLEVANIKSETISDLLEIDQEIEKMEATYNRSIMLHNEIIDMKKYKFQIKLLKPDYLKDFKLKRHINS